MRIAVLGAGTMGSGIAQLAAMHSFEVALFDIDQLSIDKAETAIGSSLARFVAKGRMTDAEADRAKGMIRPTTYLADAVSRANTIIEAVPEDLALKQDVVRKAAASAPGDALIGSNTSQLSITSIAKAIGSDAPRVIGTHFFNPPVLMKLVEIVRGEQTADSTLERARAFAKQLGKEVVVVAKDSAGFITTRVSAIVRLECLRILEEGIATPEDIDRACRLGLGFPMGPIELGDFNGLDTYLMALESLEEAYGERFRPTSELKDLVAAGRFGRKTGSGFFEYDADGNRVLSEDVDG